MKLTVSFALAFGLCVSVRADNTSQAFIDVMKQNLAAWDANHNDALELAEIDKAIANPEVRGSAAVTAAALHRGFKSMSAESISISNAQAAIEKHSVDKKALTDFEGSFEWATKRLQQANRKLFVTTPPRIDTLKQGKLGDCFCLAALRTVLQREPEAITRMIKPQADGSFVVRIGEKDVRTPALTDGEIILGASTSDGQWPLVYEKAVGLLQTKADARDATAFNVVTKGGSAGTMMSKLTAHEIKRWSCKTWRDASKDKTKQDALLDDLRKELRSAFDEKRLVTAGTSALAKGKTGVPGMTYNHGYAVIGYNAAKDEMQLWNPHGNAFTPKGEPGIEHGYPLKQGELRVPLTELVTFFGGFAFEQTAPLSPPQP